MMKQTVSIIYKVVLINGSSSGVNNSYFSLSLKLSRSPESQLLLVSFDIYQHSHIEWWSDVRQLWYLVIRIIRLESSDSLQKVLRYKKKIGVFWFKKKSLMQLKDLQHSHRSAVLNFHLSYCKVSLANHSFLLSVTVKNLLAIAKIMFELIFNRFCSV